MTLDVFLQAFSAVNTALLIWLITAQLELSRKVATIEGKLDPYDFSQQERRGHERKDRHQ